MRRKRSLFRWFRVAIAVAVLLMCGVAIGGVGHVFKEKADGRADVITIDTMRVFGDLEREPVAYMHDRHTEALARQGKDCLTCHLPEENPKYTETEGRLSTKFMRLADTDRDTVLDVYHNNCIGCHRETASEGFPSGPQECGACHVEKPIASTWQPMGLDRSLHYRHDKAHDKKCELCHHEYDERAQKLVYVKGNEGTCRYCHTEKTEENRISMRQASHLACIDCHRKALDQRQKSGPINCSGCHDAEEQQMIEKVANIPRMERNQPDIVLVKSSLQEMQMVPETSDLERVNRVPFDHKSHEMRNDTCRVCHHADMKACNTCHTQTGDKKGDYVSLEQAMHQNDSEKSCVGCHQLMQNDRSCAGCHTPIEKTRKKDEAACLTCHVPPLPGYPTVLSEEDEQQMASQLIAYRMAMSGTYAAEQIPEIVTIGVMSNLYEPVEMPHRKIIDKMLDDIKDNRIAAYFHREQGTVCQGCHHNSPASAKPPRCGSCHGKPFDATDPFKPGLMAAYHRQCMECHEVMHIAKPDSRDCSGCHFKKKEW